MINRDIIVRYIPLPWSVGGFVSEDADGFYNIYINSRLSMGQQAQALKHELEHIANEDIDSNVPIWLVEKLRRA